MKKFWIRITTILLSITMIVSLTACGKKDSINGRTKVDFWVYGSPDETAMYRALVNEFNYTYGKEKGIYVNMVPKPVGDYLGIFEKSANSRSGTDLGFVGDHTVKKWIFNEYICNIQSYVDAHPELWSKVNLFEKLQNRYRVNTSTNTSNPTDPLYGIALDPEPTALYYNEDYFEQAGIKCISVDEENLAKWNNNEIADNKGKKKSDYGINYNVPAKGYYRSENPYVDGGNWTKPTSDEHLVFNNRIAMNWDEVEDLAMLFTRSYNKNSPSSYGYFTECWFNYAWSIGGDCLNDLNGRGEWNFSLLESANNYIVEKGKTYVGEFSGKTYAQDEVIAWYDKMNVKEQDISKVIGLENGYYEVNGVTLKVRDSIKQAFNSGNLKEMPSTKDAFVRYLRTGSNKDADVEGAGGLAISPGPQNFSDAEPSTIWFVQGEIAMLAESGTYMKEMATTATSLKFNIAPLVQFKEYEDPLDPECDTVKLKGLKASHNQAKTLVVTKNSQVKDEAVQFALWSAGPDGQRVRTSQGYFSVSPDYINDIQFTGSRIPQNYKEFAEALEYQRPGDWWYMPDFEWVTAWSTDLNTNVRNNKKTYSAWAATAVPKANEKLVEYKKFNRG